MASLVSAILFVYFDFEDGDILQNKVPSCLKELHSVAHVENLELVPWCIEVLLRVCEEVPVKSM